MEALPSKDFNSKDFVAGHAAPVLFEAVNSDEVPELDTVGHASPALKVHSKVRFLEEFNSH
eukprot:6690277-Karenia_brevis.AAC.1